MRGVIVNFKGGLNMDSYIKWVDTLPKIVKLIIAIFVDVLFDLYRIFKCVLAKDFGDKFVFAIIATVIWPIGLVLDVINVIKNDKPASSWTEADEKIVDVKVEEKKEETKAEEKPAEEKPAEEKPADPKPEESKPEEPKQ